MDFVLSDEQQILLDTARHYIDKSYTFEDRKRVLKGGGFERTTWQTFGEMGWLAASIPESQGGGGFRRGRDRSDRRATRSGPGAGTPYAVRGVSQCSLNHCGGDE